MKLLWALGLVLGTNSVSFVFASDHIDGPVTSKHRITDLTDFFAFETPDKPGYLTLVANVHPLAGKKNHFDSKVLYRFTLREATIGEANAVKTVSTKEESEKRILCTFVTPHHHDRHTAKCSASPEMERTVTFNEIDSKFDGTGLRIFAGHRADPFFFNADWAKAAATEGRILPAATDNTMDMINVLSIVLDVDVSQLFGHPVSLLALTVESLSKQADGKLRRFDRIGRPEVTNVTMVAHTGDKDLRDLYNVEKAFQVSKNGAASYRRHIEKNVAYYDKLDGLRDWTPEKAHKYSEIIVDDFLLIDLSRPVDAENGYFGIEMTLLEGRVHESCGGRQLNDDIMDKLFTILINADSGKNISDGINKPSPATSAVFPYLAKPDFSWRAQLKALIADLFI